jgi:hypothetical protein
MRKNSSIALLLTILFCTELFGLGQTESSPIRQSNEDNQENVEQQSDIYSEIIDYTPSQHGDLLDSLLRLNWYWETKFLLPRIPDITISSRFTGYWDVINGVRRYPDSTDLLFNSIYEISMNSSGMITKYCREIVPNRDESTAKNEIFELRINQSEPFLEYLIYEDGIVISRESLEVTITERSDRSIIFSVPRIGFFTAITPDNEGFVLYTSTSRYLGEQGAPNNLAYWGRLSIDSRGNGKLIQYQSGDPQTLQSEFDFNGFRLVRVKELYDIIWEEYSIVELNPYTPEMQSVNSYIEGDPESIVKSWEEQRSYFEDGLLKYAMVIEADHSGYIQQVNRISE